MLLLSKQQLPTWVKCKPWHLRTVLLCSVWLWSSWWRHQMETFSALLAICVGNSPVTGEFTTQRPVTRSFDEFFDLRLNKRLSKQSWGWWFETLSRPLWRHCNVLGVPNELYTHCLCATKVTLKDLYKTRYFTLLQPISGDISGTKLYILSTFLC